MSDKVVLVVFPEKNDILKDIPEDVIEAINVAVNRVYPNLKVKFTESSFVDKLMMYIDISKVNYNNRFIRDVITRELIKIKNTEVFKKIAKLVL